MNSKEKEQLRYNKFNYLQSEDAKHRLLANYQKLGSSPYKYKRSYHLKQYEKQNVNQNQGFQECNKYEYSLIKNYQMNKNMNNKLVGFQGNKNINNKLVGFNQAIRQNTEEGDFIIEKQNKLGNNVRKLNISKQSPNKYVEQQNKFGNNLRKINISKQSPNKFDNTNKNRKMTQDKGTRNYKQRQLPPYGQQPQHLYQKNLAKLQQPQLYKQNSDYTYKCGIEQKQLVHELEQQHSTIKGQLRQAQYQNQLLKQKVQHLHTENVQLRNFEGRLRQQFIQNQLLYKQEIQSQIMVIQRLQKQIQYLQVQFEEQLALKDRDSNLIVHLQQLMKSQADNVGILQGKLNQRDQNILKLRAKLQLVELKDQENCKNQKNQKNRRRKSLDLSRKAAVNQNYQRNVKKSNYQPNSQNILENQWPTFNNKNKHIGGLMSKTQQLGFNQKQNQQQSFNINNTRDTYVERRSSSKSQFSSLNNPNENRLLKSTSFQRNASFVQSIKSMYYKISNRQAKDLKQLWKWLKLIAHYYQSFHMIYNMRNSIQVVLEDLQIKKQGKGEQQLSFMEKQYLRIVGKIYDIVSKADPAN